MRRKDLVWLHGEVKSPPFGTEARFRAGEYLGQLQNGQRLGLPQSRPMPAIGMRCHELRIQDARVTWRIVYRIDADAIVVADVFVKKTRSTPGRVIETCRRRLRDYDSAVGKRE